MLQLGVTVNLKSQDEKAIKQQLVAHKSKVPQAVELAYRPVSDMHVKVLQLTPYVINI